MSTIMLSRLLGWFSLALGTMELAVPGKLQRQLGLPRGPWLLRAFGLREITAGVAVLRNPDRPFGPSSRVAGDVMDIAVLAAALAPANPRRRSAQLAMALVLGVTALDVLCTSALLSSRRRQWRTAQRTNVAAIGQGAA